MSQPSSADRYVWRKRSTVREPGVDPGGHGEGKLLLGRVDRWAVLLDPLQAVAAAVDGAHFQRSSPPGRADGDGGALIAVLGRQMAVAVVVQGGYGQAPAACREQRHEPPVAGGAVTFRECGVDNPVFATVALMVAEPAGHGQWHP
jgi:hypothetical protein